MKSIDIKEIDQLPGRQLKKGDTFKFRCHPEIECFNLCCRNLNLFLYPYDVLRLKNCLDMTSDQFLEQYVDVVLRPESYFPEVLLRMADNAEKTCPFLTDAGCSVYPDRADTCRTFPVEHGLAFNDAGKAELIHFFRPPDFCLGPQENQEWNIDTWTDDQDAQKYNQMTVLWAEIKGLMHSDPWQGEGPQGPRAKMAFMAAYNPDQFREFVFGSSFLKRYKIKKDLKRKIRRNDHALLKLGFEWIKFYLWGIRPVSFKVK